MSSLKCSSLRQAGVDVLTVRIAGKAATLAERVAGRAGGSIAAREQEDAQEWLTFILDQAHTELLRLRTQHAARLGQLGANSNERPEQAEESIVCIC